MIADKLLEHLKEPVESMGYIFWGIEIESRPKGNGPLIRIYIDHEEGISVSDCQKASNQITAILDVEDLIASDYVLEVSSPGADRRVFTLPQAKSLEGFQFKVRLFTAVENRKNLKAKLESVDGNTLTFLVENETVKVDFDNIDKMRVIPQW